MKLSFPSLLGYDLGIERDQICEVFFNEMIRDVGGRLPGIGSVFEAFPLDEVFPFVIWAFENVLHYMSILEDVKTIPFCCPRVLVVTQITIVATVLIFTSALFVTAALHIVTAALFVWEFVFGITSVITVGILHVFAS